MKINRFNSLKSRLFFVVFVLGTAFFSCGKSDSVMNPNGFLSNGQKVSIRFKYLGEEFVSNTNFGWAAFTKRKDGWDNVISFYAQGQYGYSLSAQFRDIANPRGTHTINGDWGNFFIFNMANSSLRMNEDFPNAYINLRVDDIVWVESNFYSVQGSFDGYLYNSYGSSGNWTYITEGTFYGGGASVM